MKRLLILLALVIPTLIIAQKGCHVFGKIKQVEYGEDYKVKVVEYGEDYKVKIVEYGEGEVGKWKLVEYGEKHKIKWVEYGEDFKIKLVEYGEGCNTSSTGVTSTLKAPARIDKSQGIKERREASQESWNQLQNSLQEAQAAKAESLRIQREETQKAINAAGDNLFIYQTLVSESQVASQLEKYDKALLLIDSAIWIFKTNFKVKSLYPSYGERWAGDFQLSNHYNSAGWYALLTNNLLEAEKYLEKGLALGTTNRYFASNKMYLIGNLGLVYLLKGDFPKAEKMFLSYNKNQKIGKTKWKDMVRGDLKKLEDLGMGNEFFFTSLVSL